MLIRVRTSSDPDAIIFATDLKRPDVSFFGQALNNAGLHTIIGVDGPIKVTSDGYLEFSAKSGSVLNVGSGTKVFVLSLGQSSLIVSPEFYVHSSDDFPDHGFAVVQGDKNFLDVCAKERIPSEIIELGADLLRAVRVYSSDTLFEGKNRKWYTKPQNFLAITIQNTKRRLCVQVKETQVLDTLSFVEVHRDKRYVRMFLERKDQLEDVKKAVRASYLHG